MFSQKPLKRSNSEITEDNNLDEVLFPNFLKAMQESNEELLNETAKLEEKQKVAAEQIDQNQVKIIELNDQIEKAKAERKSVTETYNLTIGYVSENDKNAWIKNSGFEEQIKKIQEKIQDLKGLLVWNGKAKAAAISTALDRAIIAAMQREATSPEKKFNFEEFLDYHQTGSSIFWQQLPSLRDEISSSRRGQDFDDFFGIKPGSSIFNFKK